jgi:hypothetical protein
MQPKTRTLLFILLSFFAGVVLGWFLENRVARVFQHPQEGGRIDFRQMFIDRLHLDQRQIVMVDSILENRKGRMEAIRKHVAASRDTTNTEIKKILTQEQIKLYDQLTEEMEKKFSRRNDHAEQGKK